MKRVMNLMAAAILTASSSMAFAQTDLSLWYHGAGNDKEKAVLTGIISDFNGSQSDWKVSLAEFPQESYNESVVAAALSGKLPDILDVDGPLMPNWAWSKYLTPLDISDEDVKDFLPGTIGRYDGKIYSVGLWDAAVALFARKSVLEKHNLRVPTLDKPWNLDEFNIAINKLKTDDSFEYPLDLGLAWKGEWYSYAFGPLLQSWGGDLMDPAKPTAEGVLNGDEAIAFGEWWQNLFTKKLVPGTSQDGADRETGFLDGKYAMQWNGNWAALPALEKFGEDLLFLPAPNMGKGSKIGAASWQFGVSGTSNNKKGANDFIRFAMQDKYLANFSNATGLIPATAGAAKLTDNYKDDGKLNIFYKLTEKQATKRAVTPAYNVATLEFEKALSDIANGADVADTLDAATDAINKDLEKNKNYQ